MKAYYNEHDKKAAAWLRELIKDGLITDGEVDERSIEDVLPTELAKFDRCHFFAGIGGWDYALQLAGWPDERKVWTGSCPCQPYSAAGKGGGFDDERHLWPAWFHLIDQCRPDTIFGEQVAAKSAMPWLDLVYSDLEGIGYTAGAIDFPAAGVGAFHIRQRLYFVVDSGRGSFRGGRSELGNPTSGVQGKEKQREWVRSDLGDGGIANRGVGQADASSNGHSERHAGSDGTLGRGEQGRMLESEGNSTTDELEVAVRCGRRGRSGGDSTGDGGKIQTEGRGSSDAVALGDSVKQGRERRLFGRQDQEREIINGHSGRNGTTDGFWHDAEWIYCRDEKYRPVKPGIFPLVDGLPGRVGLLRGAGNAIVPEQAAEFIKSYLDVSG